MEVTTDYNGVDGATSDYNYHSSNINSSNNYNNNNINNANNKNSNYNKKNNNSKRHSSLSRHNRTSNSNNIINNKQKDKRIEPTKSDEVQQQVRNLIDNTLSNNFLIIKLVNALKKDLEHQKCSIVTVLTMKELLQSEQQENCTACLMNYSLSIKVLISAIQLHPIKYDSHITVVLEIFILLISRNSYYKVVLISNRVVRIVVNMIETVKSRKLISLAVQLLSDLLLSHTFWRDVSIPNVDFSRIYQGSLERSSLSTDEGDSVNSKIGVDFSEKEDSHSLVDSDQHSEGYLRIVDSIPFDILRLLRSPREVTKRGGLKLLLLILDSSIATRSLFNDDNSVSQTGNRKYDDSSRNYKDSVGGGFDEWKSSLIAQLALVLLDANAVNTQFEAIEIAIKLHSYTKLHSNCTNVNNFLVILQEIIGTVAVLKLSVDGKSILHSNQFCLKAYRDNTTTRTRTSSGVSKRKSSRLRQYYDCMVIDFLCCISTVRNRL